MHSTVIDLSSKNTRDLYGIKNENAFPIKKHLLIRSGRLAFLTDNDMNVLRDEYGLKKIIDLRNHAETVEETDPRIEGVEYINLPLQKEENHALAKDEESLRRMQEYFKELRKRLEGDAKEVIKHMAGFYRDMAQSPYTASQFGRFIKEVCDTDGAVLWHCSLGKDRAGLATVIILELLDVERQDIYDDYLYTNRCLYGDKGPKDPLDYMDRAVKNYLDAFYDEVEKRYGSFDAYLLKMDIDHDLRERFKIRYLKGYR